MTTIDDKVVAISFESSKFESGVNRTIAALEKLKAALHFPTAGKGLADIDAAAKKVDLSHISNGVDGVKRALESLRLIAIGVMSQLATQAVRAGGRILKAFTLDPLKQGFQEYETNIKSVQTILANTQAAGTTLKDVNAALKELNEYSDKTIYNFSQMAKNIGTFTAAGVALEPATAAIKGIANLAAISGSSSEQASTAMYQLSQALSAGRVTLMDWNSVVNAGMGGTVFQRALAQTAEVMGTLEKGAVKLTGPMKNVTIAGESFRNSLSAKPGEESWLTSDVLTKTLAQFTGDLTDAELAAMGFNKAQIAAIQQTADTAMKAATEVKTFSDLMSTTKEQVATGWADTWAIIFGDFGEAKTLFTGISGAIGEFISKSAEARNKVLGDWKALGGRTVLINSIKTAFQALGQIIAPIKDAFRDIFPAATGKDLYNLTLRFQDFANALKPSEQTVENLRRTFRGLFAVFSIIGQVLGEVFGMFGRLFGSISDGSGGFLEFTGSVGDFLVKIDQALKKGDGLHDFFQSLGDVIAIPLNMLKRLASAIADLFSGFSSGGFSGQMEGMATSLSPLQKIFEALGNAWTSFVDSVKESGILQAALDGLIAFIQGIGPAIGQAASSMNFEAILAVIRTGLFGGLVLMLKKFFGKGSFLEQIQKGFAGGIIENIAGTFKALEGSMVAMQNNIRAKTLKEIAIAIALLTASVVALSFIDSEGLTKSITAIGFMMGGLLGAMTIMEKVAKSAGFIKMPFIASALVILAGAIDLLVIAVYALSTLSWEELLKGLGGVGALLAGISAASIPLSANSGGMIRAGIGITALAIAMNLLAFAVKQFAGMDLKGMAQGLGAVAASLGIMVAAMTKMPKGMVAQGAALVIIAGALALLAVAVEKFAGMDLRAMIQGLAGIGGALVIIAGAMHIMPKGLVLQAAGLLILAFALQKIGEAIQQMGGMSWQEIAKGLVSLGGALLILAGGLYLMEGALPGAAALTVAAAGIALLAGALVKMGGMSWGEILKGLVVLGASLAVIGAAGALLTPVIPSLLGLGAALLLIGAGLALAGAGIALIGVGLSAIAVAGPTAIGILVAAFGQLVEGIIENAKLIVLGLLEIVQAFADTAPQFVEAIVQILGTLLEGVTTLAPQLGEAFNAILTMVLGVIDANKSRLIQAGFDLLLSLIQGLRNNIPALVTAVVSVITRFIGALQSNLGRIITAGTQLLLSLVKGIVSVVPQIVTTALQIINRFLTTIAGNLGRIATAGLQLLSRFLRAIAGSLGEVIAAGVSIIVAMVRGIGSAAGQIVTAARQSATKFMNTLVNQIVQFSDDVFNAMITLMNGLAQTIRNRAPEMRSAAIGLGAAIIQGLTSGVTSAAGDLYATIQGVMDRALSLVKKIPLIGSPSKVTTGYGEEIINGLTKGIEDTAPQAYDAAATMSQGIIDTTKKIFQITSPSKVMVELGKEVSRGFAQGIRGSADDIRGAFVELNNKLRDTMQKSREIIKEETAKLKEEQAKAEPDTKAIKKLQAVIAENEEILRKSSAAHKVLTEDLKKEKAELIGLANEYERLSEKLKAAKEKLAEATRTRDEAIKSYSEQYGALPDISEDMAQEIADANLKIQQAHEELTKTISEGADDLEKIAKARQAVVEAEAAKAELVSGKVLTEAGDRVDLVKTYMEQLRQQTEDVRVYAETLRTLQEMGLEDATYKKLVEMGTAGQEFASGLVEAGPEAVSEVNKLNNQLETEATNLGIDAGRNLYQAGVDAAQGLVKGLTSQVGAARRAAEQLAQEMIDAINAKFKTKSPSKVFAEIGGYAVQGLAQGFSAQSKQVTTAVENVATDAISAMQRSMYAMSEAISSEIPDPVITPILDLTQVRSQAAELGALTRVAPITAAASYNQAALISSEQAAAQEELAAVGPGATSVKFEQNNYSPESLSEIQIYRQTRNQLSQLKSVLAIT